MQQNFRWAVQMSRIGFLALLLASAPALLAESPLPSSHEIGLRPGNQRSIIGGNSLQDIESVGPGLVYELSKPVARMEDLEGRPFCTGFRVGENLIMTNFHCWEAGLCEAQFRFNYERSRPESEHVLATCQEVLAKNESLDFAVYRVSFPETSLLVDLTVATLSKSPRVIGTKLLLPGHPAGWPKLVDLSDECQLTRVDAYEFNGRMNIDHQCDTLGGSSGAPVMNRETGEVLGIHWTGLDGTSSNHAVPMDLILEFIESSAPELYSELKIAPVSGL